MLSLLSYWLEIPLNPVDSDSRILLVATSAFRVTYAVKLSTCRPLRGELHDLGPAELGPKALHPLPAIALGQLLEARVRA